MQLLPLTSRKERGGENRESSARPSYEPSTPVIVTRDDPSLPAGCRPRQVAGLITNFLDAFNRGDQEWLSCFVSVSKSPGPGGFTPGSWYSVSEDNRNFVAYDQAKLRAYFANRHKQRERLRLLMVDVGWAGNGQVGIGYVLARQADDIKPGPGGTDRFVEGKGQIDCKRQKIFVWSMGMDPVSDRKRTIPAWPQCPKTSGWEPGEPVIACARP